MCNRLRRPYDWLLICTVACLPTARAKEPLVRTFDRPMDQVYIAAVQAVGSTMKSTVKEACTVNFASSSTTNFSRAAFHGSLICRDAGAGKTTVRLSLREGAGGTLFTGPAKDSLVRTIWHNLDAALQLAFGPSYHVRKNCRSVICGTIVQVDNFGIADVRHIPVTGQHRLNSSWCEAHRSVGRNTAGIG